MQLKSNITDIPRNLSNSDSDSFEITRYENGLTNFIRTTNTPITIALQGEWGSGKTSMMNSLRYQLCESSEANYESIWLNTWEFALMKDAESTLMEVILKLIYETTTIAKTDDDVRSKLLKKAAGIGKGLLKFGTKVAADKVIDGAGDALNEHLFGNKGRSTIGEIRDDLESVIQSCIEKTNKSGIIFFIDDLDRIDPPVAVNLLELLKNIFTLKNCVFVLAIDYEVVIKGLEPKFGKLTEKNEREFRSFFDKIIQVPFTMPVSSYKIDTFLRESLLQINYLNKEQTEDNELVKDLSEICNLTVGSNPRAMKRLINSLSLISNINKATNQNEEENTLTDSLELMTNFALVSIQIAYPAVYRLLNNKPGFDQWNNQVALQMNLKSLDEQSLLKLNTDELFNEEWEQVLFRVCENDPYLKKRAVSISRLLNKLKKKIIDKDENVENFISPIISLSAVTSLDSSEVEEVKYHASSFLKDVRWRVMKRLREILPEKKEQIRSIGKRVQTNADISFSETDNPRLTWIRLHSHPYEGKIRLILYTEVSPCKVYDKSFKELVELSGLDANYTAIETSYNSFCKKYEHFEPNGIAEYLGTKNKNHTISLYGYVIHPTTDSFVQHENIENICLFITDWLEQRQQLVDFGKKLTEALDKIEN